MARLLYGGLNSLLIAGAATCLTLFFATLLGLAAGFFGGMVDMVLSRILDVLWAFPVYLLAISLSIVLITQGITIGPIAIDCGSLWLPIFIIGIIYIPYVARPIRGQVLSLRESEFVLAAIGLGVPATASCSRDILPNVSTTLIVFVPLMMALNMLTESALSFLSIGVQPPDASWGTIIQDGQGLLYTRPIVALAPGIAIVHHGAGAQRVRRRLARRARPAIQDQARARLMLLALVRRFGQMLFVMFGISVLVFLIFFATPGADPAARIAGRNASPEVLEAVRKSFGFDQPVYVQYCTMMKKIFITGDLTSFVNRGWKVVPGGARHDAGDAVAGDRRRGAVGGLRPAHRPRRRGHARHLDRQAADGARPDRHFHAGLLAGRSDEPHHPEPLSRHLAVLLGAAARLQESHR